MRTWFVAVLLSLSTACLEITSEPPLLGTTEQAARHEVDHTCTLSTLPTTCGVPPQELPCCAVETPLGEEQINCCLETPGDPEVTNFVHRLCADGRPRCTGGQYANPDNPCQGLVCPALSWPCDVGLGPECCNECGDIGPRGCSVCERVEVDTQYACRTFGAPGNDVCIGIYQHAGRSTRVTLPSGMNAPP